jgi:hypothetical protein
MLTGLRREIWAALVVAFAAATPLHAQDPSIAGVGAATFLEVNGRRLSLHDEYVVAAASGNGVERSLLVVWGGVRGDSTRQAAAPDVAGRFVLLGPDEQDAMPDSTMRPVQEPRFRGAAVVAIITGNLALLGHTVWRMPAAATGASPPPILYVSIGTASQLLGRETIDNSIEPGTTGKTVRTRIVSDH